MYYFYFWTKMLHMLHRLFVELFQEDLNIYKTCIMTFNPFKWLKRYDENWVFRANNVLQVMYLSTYSIEFYVHCAIKSMYCIDWYILLENLIISSSFLFWSHILQDYCSAFIYMERKLKGDIIHFFLPF